MTAKKIPCDQSPHNAGGQAATEPVAKESRPPWAPWGLVGHVPWINGRDAAPCPQIQPTRHEVEQLARYWLGVMRKNDVFFLATRQTGSTELRENLFAHHRVNEFASIIGEDRIRKLIAQVEEDFPLLEPDVEVAPEEQPEGGTPGTEERRYCVFNVTDRIIATRRSFTLGEAREFVRAFPRRFEQQGYYLTSDRQRIAPEDVELRIVPSVSIAGGDDPERLQSAALHPALENEIEVIAQELELDPAELRRLAIEDVQNRHEEGFISHDSHFAHTDSFGRARPTIYDLKMGAFTLHFSYESEGIMVRGFSWPIDREPLDDRDGGWIYV